MEKPLDKKQNTRKPQFDKISAKAVTHIMKIFLPLNGDSYAFSS
jgi:hypothetical protein